MLTEHPGMLSVGDIELVGVSVPHCQSVCVIEVSKGMHGGGSWTKCSESHLPNRRQHLQSRARRHGLGMGATLASACRDSALST